MEDRIARVLSYLFHPIMMPCYVLLVMFQIDALFPLLMPWKYKLLLMGIVFLTTVLLPLFFTFILFRLQFISSLFMVRKEERTYPLLTIAVFFYITYYLLRGIHFSTIFSFYMLGATFLAILMLVINYYYKISLHMTGIGSFVGFFLGLSLNFGLNLNLEILLGIFFAGWIGFGRMKMNSHHPSELITGFITGSVVMTTIMLLI
ncbi:MAG: hypothetical protein PHF97_02765 [Bacteroidales bacterium]|jgi:prepilin signal peptidase PulO-like enzyme (type II secretory pathway)|nr:hypothetical protein [Bacteroidales bacterium]MDD4602715.1 hypothetical protein [Bacteroidales bacterium]